MGLQLKGVKSLFKSKTALTGFLLSLFGMLNALGVLPAGFDATQFVNSLLIVGGFLVATFRNMATEKTSVVAPITTPVVA
jgi:hypothetical protein